MGHDLLCRLLISTHALREEGDWSRDAVIWGIGDFYPRPPRGGRHDDARSFGAYQDISTHALREEGDLGLTCR